MILASEAGTLPIPQSQIKKKWRLQPGKMFMIDTEQGRIIEDEEIKRTLALSNPYKEWTKRLNIHLSDVVAPPPLPNNNPVPLIKRQEAFGYGEDDIKFVLRPMAEKGCRSNRFHGKRHTGLRCSLTEPSRSISTSVSCLLR